MVVHTGCLDGNIDEARLSNPELLALNRLRRAGLVTDDGGPVLSQEVRNSFLLDRNQE